MATSSERLEREAEDIRERLTLKLEDLRAQITPGRIVDQLTDYARDSGGAELARNLGRQIRDNPLPLLLMGGALAWLMIGQGNGNGAGAGPTAERIAAEASNLARRFGSKTRKVAAQSQSSGENIADAFRDQLSGVQARRYEASATAGDTVRSAGSYIRDTGRQAQKSMSDMAGRAASATSSMSEAASSSYEQLSGAASNMGRTVSDKAVSIAQNTSSATRSFASLCAEQPLVLAGIGIAIGAALGAALPTTSAEDRLMGETAEDIKRKGQQAASETVAKAKQVAESGYEAARNEAEHQGLPVENAEHTTLVPGG